MKCYINIQEGKEIDVGQKMYTLHQRQQNILWIYYMEDYKFKFSISKSNKKYLHFNDFLKDNILDLLSFCEFYDEYDKILDVARVRVKHPGEKKIELYNGCRDKIKKNTELIGLSEDEKAVDSSEPRISYIIKTLKNMNTIVDLYSSDNKLNVDKIELKDCKQWILNERAHASTVYQYLAHTCNANCKFCYLQANPSNIRIGKKENNADCSKQELMTRIKYFGENSNLFSSSYEVKEFFNSPYFEETLLELRKKCDHDFMFVTNGSLLTEEKIKFLSTVMPVTLIISVIVISEKKRGELLFDELITDEREKLNQVMMKSFSLLNKYHIPFIGSITAWPTIKYSDFIETIHYLEQFNPVAIRINMLGYTEKNKPSIPVNDEFWYDFCSYIHEASKETDVPLLPIPSQYYINEFQRDILDVEVLGVVKNSPAFGKVKKGDIVKKINGMSITSRDQLLDALNVLKGSKVLSVLRNDKIIDIILDEDSNQNYPYAGTFYGKYQFPYGIVIPESIQLKQIKEILTIMERTKKQHALLIVGPLLKKTVLRYFKLLGAQINEENSEVKLKNKTIIIVPAQNYFLGGNMKIMDMCVISDFIKVIEENKTRNTDIVILPDSMFNLWGNDLLGVHKDMLKKCVDIPVEYFKAKTVPY